LAGVIEVHDIYTWLAQLPAGLGMSYGSTRLKTDRVGSAMAGPRVSIPTILAQRFSVRHKVMWLMALRLETVAQRGEAAQIRSEAR
jgi:hypothetical protein